MCREFVILYRKLNLFTEVFVAIDGMTALPVWEFLKRICSKAIDL